MIVPLDMEKMNTSMLEYYLPNIVHKHAMMLGMSKEDTDALVKEVMSTPDNQAKYMKVIEEYNREPLSE
jgi:hypothetical protein